MKKFLTLALALMMALSLAACGEKTPAPSGSSGQEQTNAPDPGTSQQEQTPSGGELYDIADSDIRVVTVIYPVEYTYDEAERAAVLDTIPAEIKKGVGTLKQGFSDARKVEGEGTSFSAQFAVAGPDEYDTLKAYYKSLGGEVTDESNVNENQFFEMEFSWGRLWQCEYRESSAENTILVAFTINEQEQEAKEGIYDFPVKVDGVPAEWQKATGNEIMAMVMGSKDGSESYTAKFEKVSPESFAEIIAYFDTLPYTEKGETYYACDWGRFQIHYNKEYSEMSVSWLPGQ